MKGQYHNKIGIVGILLLVLLIRQISATINTSIYKDSISNFEIISQTSYDDGTILLRLSSSLTTNCNEPNLSLRLIQLDGSIKELNIHVSQIPSDNFCLIDSGNLTDGAVKNYKDHVKVYAISSEFILVTYNCVDFNLCGIVINRNGDILKDMNLGVRCTDSDIVQSVDTEFLWICYMQESNQLKWQRFSAPDTSGSFDSLASGNLLYVYNFNPNFTQFFASEYGGYGIAMAVQNQNPSWMIRVAFISSTSSNLIGPFQIYLTENNVQQLHIYKCNTVYYSYGYSCIINAISSSDGRPNLVNIEFLSSGSVLRTTPFVMNYNLISGTMIWNILPLYFGGFCILTENISNKSINGIIFSDKGIFYNNWDLPTNQYNLTKNIGLFSNNTIWAIAKSNLDTWIVVSSTFLSDYGAVQGGYGNVYIESTVPPIGSTVSLMSTQKLQIKYTTNIRLSHGNISVIDRNHDIIRQTVNSNDRNLISLVNNNMVEINVFETTFNRKNSLYYVFVDNGFVKDAKLDQDLLGIKKNVWRITTDNNLEETPYSSDSSSDSTNAIMRLTPDGTTYFTSLSSDEKYQFSKYLASNLSLIIPCDMTRISIHDRYQFDRNSLSRRVLLKIHVGKDTMNIDNIGSSQIVKDLNLLIKNKDHNAISRVRFTSFLDAPYGAQLSPNLWDRCKYILIGVIIEFAILLSLYFLANKINSNANNAVIFTFSYILMDFILDIIFISIHGNDLSWLYLTRYKYNSSHNVIIIDLTTKLLYFI